MTEKLLERRRTRRISMALPVILANATGVTRDVSPSGVFFWKRGVFAYGDSIRFSLERQTGTGRILQRCQGVVVRTDPRGDLVGVAASITESTDESVPDLVGATPSWVAAPEPLPESGDRGSDLPATVSETVDRSLFWEAPAPEPLPESVDRGSDLPATVSETFDRPSMQEAAAPEPLPESGDGGSDLPAPVTKPVDRPSMQETAAPEPLPESREGGSDLLAPVAETVDSSSLREATAPEPPPDTAHRTIHLPAAAVETAVRWSRLLRSKAFEACEELQDQEVIRWEIPTLPDPETFHRHGVTVCSITVIGPALPSSRIPEHSGFPGESTHPFDSLRRRRATDWQENAGALPVGREARSENRENHDEGRGVRMQLEVDIGRASRGGRSTDETPVPRMFIRIAPARDDTRGHAPGEDGRLPRSYNDPSVAFEAFLALAIERAILTNLDVQGLETS